MIVNGERRNSFHLKNNGQESPNHLSWLRDHSHCSRDVYSRDLVVIYAWFHVVEIKQENSSFDK